MMNYSNSAAMQDIPSFIEFDQQEEDSAMDCNFGFKNECDLIGAEKDYNNFIANDTIQIQEDNDTVPEGHRRQQYENGAVD